MVLGILNIPFIGIFTIFTTESYDPKTRSIKKMRSAWGHKRQGVSKWQQTVFAAFLEKDIAMKMQHHSTRNWGLMLALVCLAGSAMAQWQWLDADGRKIFSDKAPPPSIPESQILRDGNGHPYVPASKTKTKPAADEKAPTYGFKEYKPEPVVSPKPQAKNAAPKAQATKTPKELEQEKKAQAEQAAKEAEAKRKEQELKAANCKTIRGNMAALDSGQRIASYNEKGERSVMGDTQRAAERKSLESAMKENACQ